MPLGHQSPVFPYRRSADQDRPGATHPVVIVGGGMVGLGMAVELAVRGVASVVLDDNDTVSVGSRAICHAKRALEIYDRWGVAERMRDKGITWNRGRVFLRDRQIYDFDLLPEDGHCWPAFINLQQYYLEEWLVEAAEATGLVDLRWRHEVVAVRPRADGADLDVLTPEGPYMLGCDWLVACDGAGSLVRRALGLDFSGKVFQDRFLIADVRMHADFPTERWFWFDPPFNRGQSALLHRQADDVFRIDLQLGPDADPELERQPDRVMPRLEAMLGPERPFELEWISVYTFCCRRLERFRHGRVLFAGDSAHQVSPFGARGGNGGVQDVDNLGWKLALVLQGHAPASLLDSYDAERIPAADENILNSTRSTDFISPKNGASRAFRDAALELAASHAFARPLVNSGRLSRPHHCLSSPLSTGDTEAFAAGPTPGCPLIDAPVRASAGDGWLLRALPRGFSAFVFGDVDPAAARRLAEGPVPIDVVRIGADEGALADVAGHVAARYDGRPGTTYLVRPDHHVAARFRRFDVEALIAARNRALGIPPGVATLEAVA
jgi:3-(3-hydroxy-phenyl)propionate hydroxylase